MNQRNTLLNAQKKLGVGPVGLARLLNTPYATLKDWKSQRYVMPGVAYVAIELLLILDEHPLLNPEDPQQNSQ